MSAAMIGGSGTFGATAGWTWEAELSEAGEIVTWTAATEFEFAPPYPGATYHAAPTGRAELVGQDAIRFEVGPRPPGVQSEDYAELLCAVDGSACMETYIEDGQLGHLVRGTVDPIPLPSMLPLLVVCLVGLRWWSK